jgi:hypothetical protein
MLVALLAVAYATEPSTQRSRLELRALRIDALNAPGWFFIAEWLTNDELILHALQRLRGCSAEASTLTDAITGGTGLKELEEVARDIWLGNRGALRGVIKRYREHPWSDAVLAKDVMTADTEILLKVLRE